MSRVLSKLAKCRVTQGMRFVDEIHVPSGSLLPLVSRFSLMLGRLRAVVTRDFFACGEGVTCCCCRKRVHPGREAGHRGLCESNSRRGSLR